MRIILKQDVQGLGFEHDVVIVKPGYARNYLIPRGLAITATPSAIKVRDEVVRQQEHKRAKLIKDATDLAAALETATVKIPVKATEEGKIFGSVTSAAIAEALMEQYKYEVDKKNIMLDDNRIKELGSYNAIVNLFKDVKATLKVLVEREETEK
ncbi:MAG: 50S ribosomal protein L9 [Bacteroidales bacterium]|nr:50S ribosomal protein L9 [Bacteroidales bacterium]